MTKILVVEDNAEVRDMLSERLERRGHVVISAPDGQTALASAKASSPELILLDSQVRGDSEWAVARALKFDDHTRDIPIIALLANGSEEARALALQNGCADVHPKPVDFGRLLQQIDAAIEGEEAAADAP